MGKKKKKEHSEVQILLSTTSLKIQENSLYVPGNVPKLQERTEEQNVVRGGVKDHLPIYMWLFFS